MLKELFDFKIKLLIDIPLLLVINATMYFATKEYYLNIDNMTGIISAFVLCAIAKDVKWI